MNDNKCLGVTGWLFGHNFEDVFEDENSEPAFIPDQEVVDTSDISKIDAIGRLVIASTPAKDRFVHTVCRRCGRIVNRKDII